MSIRAVYHRCPKCGRHYPFNPDVGRFGCPFCGPTTVQWIDKILKKPKKRSFTIVE